jgi:DNA-binding transcriptional LysR family regulator
MALDLRKVAHFVAVAEERSMTRAAARLQLSQQALSISMRVLELEVGVALLDRSRRGVALLPSGEALYADAVLLLAAAAAAVERARRADRGEPELLRIGHIPAVTGVEVTAMLAGASAAPPGAAVQIVAVLPDELDRRLRDRSIDIALSRAAAPPGDMAGQVIARHRLRLAVRAGHRLAQRDAVTLPEIAAETLVVGAPPGVCTFTDLLLGLCRRAGFEPRHRVTPVQGTPPVTTVLGNDGAALVTEVPGPALGGAVQVVELEPTTSVPVLATWRGDTRSAVRDGLLTTLAGFRDSA